MQTVSRFEANLLCLLYFFLRREPADRAMPLLAAGQTPPRCLSRGAVHLIQDALTKGCVQLLAERGGWRRESFLRNGVAVAGRLWERTPPKELGLTFSRQTLEFLRWITAVKPGAKESPRRPALRDVANGDRLLLFFAYEGLRQCDGIGFAWQTLPAFAGHGLCRLMYAEDFVHSVNDDPPAFGPWTTGNGACILEALQHDLANRWVEMECRKQQIQDYQAMRKLGMEQERVVTAFLDAAAREGRWDLARFLLQAAAKLLPEYVQADFWVQSLQHGKQRLADRAKTYHLALVFLRLLPRLQAWAHQARATGYFDEGYAAAQLWQADWEQFQGDVLVERAQAIIRQLDPLG